MDGIEFTTWIMINEFRTRAQRSVEAAKAIWPRWEETGDEILEARMDRADERAVYWTVRADHLEIALHSRQ